MNGKETIEDAQRKQAAADRRNEMSLVDDLADVLSHVVVGWEKLLGVDLAQHPEVQRVMARYREAKETVDE